MQSSKDTASLASSHTHNDAPKRDVPAQELSDSRANNEDDWSNASDNPRNWRLSRKWTAVSIVSFYTFVTPLGSSMMAPGLPVLALKYGITNPAVEAMTLSVFLISFAIGPLFLGPLSEMYGRTWVLHIGNLVYLCFSLGCALAPSAGAFIAFRLLAGFAGSAPIAIGGGSVSDLFAENERASAMALYTLGPLMGPVIGPIMGGFIAQTIGIQYVFYLIVALCGIASVLAIPLLKETYAPVIRRRLGGSAVDPEKGTTAAPPPNLWTYLWINLTRPMILLTHSFICFILSLYMALIYGIFYLMFTTFPNLFIRVYGFSIGSAGLAYLGLGIGFILATLFGAKISHQIYLTLAAGNGGQGKPEMRIPALIFGSFLVPVGLLWYGWSAEARIHWIMPIIGTSIYGFALMTSFLPIQLYLVDTFAYSASALAAASVFRSFLGFIFPLFGEPMFARLGYGGGNSLLAGLAIVLGIPFPVWIYYYGERIRARSPLSR